MIRWLFTTSYQPLRSGFTLVEILIYLAIFTILSTASVAFLFSLKDIVGQYRIETILYRSGTDVMEQILLSIRQADTVDLINTVEDDPANGRLVVENDSNTTEFTFTGGELQMVLNGDNLGYLAGDGVTVSSFTVFHYPLGTAQLVRVRVALSGTAGGISKDIILQGGAVVRGSI